MNHLTGFYFEQEDNMFSDTFKVINNIRIEQFHRAAEASHYKGWDDAFARQADQLGVSVAIYGLYVVNHGE